MNLGAIVKLSRGAVGPEQLAELLKMAGLDATFEAVPLSQRQAVFQRTARLAANENSQVLAIHGHDKQGSEIEAVIVFRKKDIDTANKSL